MEPAIAGRAALLPNPNLERVRMVLYLIHGLERSNGVLRDILAYSLTIVKTKPGSGCGHQKMTITTQYP